MALFERIVGDEQPKIAVHSLRAAWGLFFAGHITLADIETEFEIDPADTDWDALKTAYQNAPNKRNFMVLLEGLMMLAEDNGKFNLDQRSTFNTALNLISSGS